ncbi:hypothetical protein GGTG_00776 [Gaeumannomyces tritici R3-111a-1]|uniref:Uncharacterized protein n=1 Tax=Gaeumannomyces tritici (strain R3-111a-1) TaxID=644352 RepID=J3NHN9_GAET3|nr:hypothetical protein GGTG_00776 [Gaeumannomyces tritici R3-111a-1]EJT80782.1 hypothetical protein GGTG_00776 [Gaeumannomyces tritici R3-111a-1]
MCNGNNKSYHGLQYWAIRPPNNYQLLLMPSHVLDLLAPATHIGYHYEQQNNSSLLEHRLFNAYPLPISAKKDALKGPPRHSESLLRSFPCLTLLWFLLEFVLIVGFSNPNSGPTNS